MWRYREKREIVGDETHPQSYDGSMGHSRNSGWERNKHNFMSCWIKVEILAL